MPTTILDLVPPDDRARRVTTVVRDFAVRDYNHDAVPESPHLSVPESFEEFYGREYRQLVGLGYVLTGSSHAAEDLVQLACTEAHRRWDTVGAYDNPGAWVRRVLVNKSTSRFRRLTTEAKALTRLGSRRAEVVEPGERVTEVWAAVRRLPARQAQAIALRYWEDRPIAEIAAVLDCSPETIKTHLKRARASLRSELGDLWRVDHD